MNSDIKLVAVDIDGTFMRDDYTYDEVAFKNVLSEMAKVGCQFVVASGNQYYQLISHFPGFADQLSYVAENGALVTDHSEIIFKASISNDIVNKVSEICADYPEIKNVMCGVKSAYCERGTVDDDFFALTNHYYPKLQWVDDFKDVDDQILKFAPTVPEEKTQAYYEMFKKRLAGLLVPTTSGHGSIDLIIPGCHKATGLKRLVERWQITPGQCVAFGDGQNDIEMLQYCGTGYAMDNATDEVKAAADQICLSNNNDGVVRKLEELFLGN